MLSIGKASPVLTCYQRCPHAITAYAAQPNKSDDSRATIQDNPIIRANRQIFREQVSAVIGCVFCLLHMSHVMGVCQDSSVTLLLQLNSARCYFALHPSGLSKSLSFKLS